MVVGVVLFTLAGLVAAVLGYRLLRNVDGWGDRFVERMPEWFRTGDTTGDFRKKLGAAWLVVGGVFAVVGLALLAGRH